MAATFLGGNVIEKIKEKFGNLVEKVFFEKEDGFDFLRVQVAKTSLDDVAVLAKSISKYLDEIDYSDKEYYLDVYSSGTETEIDKSKLEDFIGENIYVSLNEPVKNLKEFEGEILEANATEFIIRWNAKGQFRKAPIEIKNIVDIRMSTKVKRK